MDSLGRWWTGGGASLGEGGQGEAFVTERSAVGGEDGGCAGGGVAGGEEWAAERQLKSRSCSRAL